MALPGSGRTRVVTTITRVWGLQLQRVCAVPSRDFGRFVGTAPVMQRLYVEIEQVAASDERVLIRGATGTGKKFASCEVRDRSRRCGGPFVVLNCAGFDHSLIERELFGHVKGAFTGATESKQGLFEAADGGSERPRRGGSMSGCWRRPTGICGSG